jgi:hypothetical protein
MDVIIEVRSVWAVMFGAVERAMFPVASYERYFSTPVLRMVDKTD